MRLTDSRRLTGPSLLQDAAGAVIEVAGTEAEMAAAVSAWERHARRMLDALGWSREEARIRRYEGGPAWRCQRRSMPSTPPVR